VVINKIVVLLNRALYEARESLLAIMAPTGFSSYCTLKLLLSRVTVLPPRVTDLPQV
jgi:hypothetical protein